jgi:hypothetical protein
LHENEDADFLMFLGCRANNNLGIYSSAAEDPDDVHPALTTGFP